MYGRSSCLPASACCMSGLARLIGIEKPMPVEFWAIAVLMPTTDEDASSSGPPLLPGVIAASVWMRLRRFEASGVIVRAFAETMPLVTVLENVPSGLPIATTSWPTRSASESPRPAAVRSFASIFTIARSVSVSIPQIVPGYCVPSLSSTVSLLLPATTWRFVRIQPFGLKITPEPMPCSGRLVALGSTPSETIRTTAGPAFFATSMTADDSSIVTGWVTEVLFAFEGFVEAGGSSAPVAVSAAKVPPDARTAASSAAETIVPMPLLDRPPAAGCWAGGCHDGAGTVVAGTDGAAGEVEGSNQCSGVAGGVGRAGQHPRLHSVRGLGRRE